MTDILTPEELERMLTSPQHIWTEYMNSLMPWEDIKLLVASHLALHAETARLRQGLDMIAGQQYPDDDDLHADDRVDPRNLVRVLNNRVDWLTAQARAALGREEVEE